MSAYVEEGGQCSRWFRGGSAWWRGCRAASRRPRQTQLASTCGWSVKRCRRRSRGLSSHRSSTHGACRRAPRTCPVSDPCPDTPASSSSGGAEGTGGGLRRSMPSTARCSRSCAPSRRSRHPDGAHRFERGPVPVLPARHETRHRPGLSRATYLRTHARRAQTRDLGVVHGPVVIAAHGLRLRVVRGTGLAPPSPRSGSFRSLSITVGASRVRLAVDDQAVRTTAPRRPPPGPACGPGPATPTGSGATPGDRRKTSRCCSQFTPFLASASRCRVTIAVMAVLPRDAAQQGTTCLVGARAPCSRPSRGCRCSSSWQPAAASWPASPTPESHRS